MRPIGQPTLDHLAVSSGVVARLLFQLTALDTSTGSRKTILMWSGEDDRTFTIDGVTKTFTGVGGAIGVEAVEYSAGTDARRHNVTLGGLPATTEALISSLDLRLAPVKIWRVVLAPEVEVDTAHAVMSGWVDDATITTAAEGGSGSIEFTVATSAMALTQAINRRWSNATQQARSPGLTVDTATTYTTSQTVALSAGLAAIALRLVGGGEGGDSNSGNWHEGSPGGPTVATVKDSGGATVATYTAAGGAGGSTGQVLPITGIEGVSGGSVVITVGTGGAGGGEGSNGAMGAATVTEQGGSPVADIFFKYAATAADVDIKWG